MSKSKELGADAVQLFQLGSANVETILSIDSTALLEGYWTPPFIVRLNGDGTVMVTDESTP